ncbi:hypothetical protein V6N13_024131 [Hibiscus sabdariffa]
MTHSEINSIVQQSACSPLVDWMPRVSGWKDDLAYLTADSETGSHELDPTKVYSVGGLVLTLNRVIKILLKFLETRLGSFLLSSNSSE